MTLQETLFFRAKAELDMYTSMINTPGVYTTQEIEKQNERASSAYQIIEEAELVEQYEEYREAVEVIDDGKKYLGEFPLRKLFTPCIYSLMRDRSEIMLFPDNGQLLVDEEIDEWNKENGLNDPTKRILYGYHNHNHNGKFYTVKSTDYGTTLTIPYPLINQNNYLSFLQDVQDDLSESEPKLHEYVLSYEVRSIANITVKAKNLQEAKKQGDNLIEELNSGELKTEDWEIISAKDENGELRDF